VIPWSTEPKNGGLAVHTIVLFSGSCEAGKAAASALHVKLLGDVRPLFYVPAPRAKSLFGDVYMVTVGFPYLVSGPGTLQPLLVMPAPAAESQWVGCLLGQSRTQWPVHRQQRRRTAAIRCQNTFATALPQTHSPLHWPL